ncbi:MAG: hypothetical protein FJ044_03510 [Candidatus Cloacimonetes bacterium]|nr:hypothetical protein [Candidatus Cloacimonadota bacterium]
MKPYKKFVYRNHNLWQNYSARSGESFLSAFGAFVFTTFACIAFAAILVMLTP